MEARSPSASRDFHGGCLAHLAQFGVHLRGRHFPGGRRSLAVQRRLSPAGSGCRRQGPPAVLVLRAGLAHGSRRTCVSGSPEISAQHLFVSGLGREQFRGTLLFSKPGTLVSRRHHRTGFPLSVDFAQMDTERLSNRLGCPKPDCRNLAGAFGARCMQGRLGRRFIGRKATLAVCLSHFNHRCCRGGSHHARPRAGTKGSGR